MKCTAFFLCLALCLPLVACGGGGGGDDTQQLNAPPDGANSAYMTADPDGQNVFLTTDNVTAVGTIPNATTPHREERGVYSFDISGLPSGAQIVSATLTIPQTNSNGNPFSVMAIVCVDHINLGGGISQVSYNQGALSVIVNPPFSNDTNVEDKTLDVTTQVQADVDATRSNSTFRLRGHAIDPLHDAGTAQLDDVVFSAPAGTSLVIEYIEP